MHHWPLWALFLNVSVSSTVAANIAAADIDIDISFNWGAKINHVANVDVEVLEVLETLRSNDAA